MTSKRLAALICTGAAPCSSTATAANYAPRVGRPHGDFTLPSLTDHAPVSLSQFRGARWM